MSKVLYIGDACIPSGFARVTHAMCDRLVEKHDLAVFGIMYRGDPHSFPYRIYPASVHDPMGYGTLARVLHEFQPDVVILQHDPWVATRYLNSNPSLIGRTVMYYLSDGPLMHREWAIGLAAGGVSAPFTRFSAEQLQEAASRFIEDVKKRSNGLLPESFSIGTSKGPVSVSFSLLESLADINNHHVIGAGVDLEHFFPYTDTEIKKVRKTLGMPEDAFIVGNVGTNTPRKHLELTVQAFAQVAAKVPNAALLLHTQPRGSQDLPHLASYYGVADKLYFTHDAPSEVAMRDIYNCMDVIVNTSGGEGFGLPAIEGAACGVPVVVPDWGPMREIWQDSALFTPIACVYHDDFAVGVGRGLVDTRALAEQIVSLQDKDYYKGWADAALARANDPYFKWENAADRMDKAIEVVNTYYE